MSMGATLKKRMQPLKWYAHNYKYVLITHKIIQTHANQHTHALTYLNIYTHISPYI